MGGHTVDLHGLHFKVKFVIITCSLGLLPLMHTECSYGLGYQQGYQKTGSVHSTLTTKLKGAWHYNGSYGDYTQNCGNPVRNVTFDVADFVIPPLVNFEFIYIPFQLASK